MQTGKNAMRWRYSTAISAPVPGSGSMTEDCSGEKGVPATAAAASMQKRENILSLKMRCIRTAATAFCPIESLSSGKYSRETG
jgi:hypothetical protein